MRIPFFNDELAFHKDDKSKTSGALPVSIKDSLTTAVYSCLGAFSPILLSWLILSIAGRSMDLGEFSKSGDFFIIADGLVLPALLLLIRNKQVETFNISWGLIIGIMLIVSASTSYGVIKLLNIANLPVLQPNQHFVNISSSVIVLASIIYAYRLQIVDDDRVAKATETIKNSPQAAQDKLGQDFDQLLKHDKPID